MAKRLNNRQILNKLVKECDEMQLVILRERIETICEHVIESEEEVMKDWKNIFFSGQFYMNAIKKITP
jgi:hypothetical protein